MTDHFHNIVKNINELIQDIPKDENHNQIFLVQAEPGTDKISLLQAVPKTFDGKEFSQQNLTGKEFSLYKSLDQIPRLNFDFAKIHQPLRFDLEKCTTRHVVRTQNDVFVPGLFRRFIKNSGNNFKKPAKRGKARNKKNNSNNKSQ